MKQHEIKGIKMQKIMLHICCGDVYLSPGYTNVDIKGKLTSQVSTEELEKNKTDIENYFKYPFGAVRREIIIDKRIDITTPWDFETESVEEIIAISTIEHFPLSEARFIMSEMKRVLKHDGRLIIDFPDIKETVNHYLTPNPDFCMRLLYCNQKDKYSTHFWGYTKKSFVQLLDDNWKEIIWEPRVKHDYPMISCIAIKK